MEYINLIEPLGFIGLSLVIGMFMGAYWMFLLMYKTEKNLLKELDAKNKLLDSYIDVYENDDYEAY
tara:strand:+ start:838 stop:1035 length:198 start_codon:yes stop_codon:yes gene_type:complete